MCSMKENFLIHMKEKTPLGGMGGVPGNNEGYL